MASSEPTWEGLEITRDPLMAVTWMRCNRCMTQAAITDREVMLLGAEELKRIGHACDDGPRGN